MVNENIPFVHINKLKYRDLKKVVEVGVNTSYTKT